MRKLWPLLILLLPGCTFYSWSDGVRPRKTSELADISPVIYLVIAMFCLLLIAASAFAMFRERTPHSGEEKAVAFIGAILTALVVLLLVG